MLKYTVWPLQCAPCDLFIIFTVFYCIVTSFIVPCLLLVFPFLFLHAFSKTVLQYCMCTCIVLCVSVGRQSYEHNRAFLLDNIYGTSTVCFPAARVITVRHG